MPRMSRVTNTELQLTSLQKPGVSESRCTLRFTPASASAFPISRTRRSKS